MVGRAVFLAAVLSAHAVSPALLGGVPGDKAVYRGGTLGVPAAGAQGSVTTTDPAHFLFAHKGGRLAVPWERVNLLEYGQKAGRRVGVATATALIVAPVLAPLPLFSKKRRHFLTINFFDEQGQQQAVVLELGKNIVRTTLASLEARTGKKVEHLDQEARKGDKR